MANGTLGRIGTKTACGGVGEPVLVFPSGFNHSNEFCRGTSCVFVVCGGGGGGGGGLLQSHPLLYKLILCCTINYLVTVNSL